MNAITSPQEIYPFKANDIQVVEYDGEYKVRNFEASDWNNDRHKLLILYPQTFTPVCHTELGALKDWVPEFDKLDCDVIAVCTDNVVSISDWYSQEDSLKEPNFKTFSSYLLPSRLNLLDNGRCKRASVFVTKSGEVVKQEHFMKVGRSLAELHRMLYGYTTDSYCAENWQSPADGFLTPPEA